MYRLCAGLQSEGKAKLALYAEVLLGSKTSCGGNEDKCDQCMTPVKLEPGDDYRVESLFCYTQGGFSAAQPGPACLIVTSRLLLHPAALKSTFSVQQITIRQLASLGQHRRNMLPHMSGT